MYANTLSARVEKRKTLLIPAYLFQGILLPLGILRYTEKYSRSSLCLPELSFLTTQFDVITLSLLVVLPSVALLIRWPFYVPSTADLWFLASM
jgi:hypothetical protein